MKECEKALNDLPLQKECDYPSAQVAEEVGFRAGWKVALELVNSKLWLASGQVADEVKAWIKEELGKATPAPEPESTPPPDQS